MHGDSDGCHSVREESRARESNATTKKKECFIKSCYTFYAAYSSRFVAWRSFVGVGVQETRLAPCLVRASRSRCGVRKTWEDPGALCLLFVRTVNWRPPGTLVFLSTAFFDGQHKHEHAGTGAGRQVHAATRRAGRLDQEPRPTRQNGRAQVSLGALTVKESVRVGARIASPERAGRWAVVLSAVFFLAMSFQFSYLGGEDKTDRHPAGGAFAGNMRLHCSCRLRTYSRRTPR